MKVFVTVGTTRFDALVARVGSDDFLDALAARGYDELLVQTGASPWPRRSVASAAAAADGRAAEAVAVKHFDYKPSIAEDIRSADLVISHAGAGTCLEVLGAHRPLIVVVNQRLMNNHQSELAEKLAQLQHLEQCSGPESLVAAVRRFDASKLLAFLAGDGRAFAAHVDALMGV